MPVRWWRLAAALVYDWGGEEGARAKQMRHEATVEIQRKYDNLFPSLFPSLPARLVEAEVVADCLVFSGVTHYD